MENKKKTFLVLLLIFSMSLPMLSSCALKGEEVVIYTSVDQLYSEKIFKAYEKETGVKVKAVYDAEATKTVGLVNRLISEKEKPQADLFWNGEILQTIHLKENGILVPVVIESASSLPKAFVDKDNQWFAFGGRARCLTYNKTKISYEDCPKTLKEFLENPNVEKSGLAYPMFGTTSTHAAVLYSYWGASEAKEYYTNLKNGGVQILDGNGTVKDYVSQKKIYYGLTDTDDALLEITKNKDLDVIFLDQEEGGIGTLVIPNSVGKIKGGPNPNEADKFIEYILSAEAEQILVDDEWIQIPVHPTVNAAEIIQKANVRIMDANFEEAYEYAEEAKTDLSSIFVR